MNKLTFALLCVFTFVIPWEEVIQFTGFGSLTRAIGAVTLLVGIAHVLVARRIRPLSWFHAFALLFLLWAALGLFWTVDPDSTRERVVTYTQLAAFAWIVWEFAPSAARQRTLLQAYVLGAYVAVISTLADFVAGRAMTDDGTRFAGLGDNPNELGFTIALGLPMAWYLALAQPRGVFLWLNRLFVPLGMIAILLTGSRGAFVPALAALLLIPWTLPRLRLGTKVVACALAIAALVAAARLVPEASLERLATTSQEIGRGKFGGRFRIWQAGFETFTQHPLLGLGAGSFRVAVAPVLGYRQPPHQTYLSVLVGGGLVGFLLFAGMFAGAMLALRSMARLERRFWLVMLLTLGIGLMPRTWDYSKALWLSLSLLATQGAVAPNRRAYSPLRLREAVASR